MSTSSNTDFNMARLDLVHALGKVEGEFNALMERYQRLIESRVDYLLPSLSWAAYMRLLEQVPSFFVPVRQDYFKKFMLRYWFIKPRGYQEALVYLQAQLRAFLLNSGNFKNEEDALHLLNGQRSALMGELEHDSRKMLARRNAEYQAKRRTREKGPTDDACDLTNPLNPLSPLNQMHPLNPMNPFNLDVADSRVEIVEHKERELSAIATDDRLGYFS